MTMLDSHGIWCEKYRPNKIENYIGNDQFKTKIQQYIDTSDVPHLLLYGPAGTGKTTAAKLIVDNIDCDFLYINASDENSVETVRNKIKNFASSAGFRSLKIIILDEADYMTINGQAALRNLMETHSRSTRFILTCNYIERMLEPIISRTQQFRIVPPTKSEVARRLIEILHEEKIQFQLDDLKILIDAYYPDIRKIINECQLNTVNDTLTVNKESVINSDINLQIIEILKSSASYQTKFSNIRQKIANSKIKDFSDLYRLLYDKVSEYTDKVGETILIIADGQYKDVHVIDKEINMMATIINILQLK